MERKYFAWLFLSGFNFCLFIWGFSLFPRRDKDCQLWITEVILYGLAVADFLSCIVSSASTQVPHNSLHHTKGGHFTPSQICDHHQSPSLFLVGYAFANVTIDNQVKVWSLYFNPMESPTSQIKIVALSNSSGFGWNPRFYGSNKFPSRCMWLIHVLLTFIGFLVLC